MRYLRSIRQAMLGAILFCVGCGGEPTTHVTGKVTLDGRPLTTGTVTLLPLSTGRPVIGNIGADGRFVLETMEDDRIAPGHYTATVIALSGIPTQEMTSEERDALILTPPRYNNMETSGLKYTLAPGENTIEVALSSISL